MKGKRRRARSRSSKQNIPVAAQAIGFTESEEAFFLAGTQLSDGAISESFDDLEASNRRRGWLRRLFARSSFAS
jgi:hypothetical protein